MLRHSSITTHRALTTSPTKVNAREPIKSFRLLLSSFKRNFYCFVCICMSPRRFIVMSKYDSVSIKDESSTLICCLIPLWWHIDRVFPLSEYFEELCQEKCKRWNQSILLKKGTKSRERRVFSLQEYHTWSRFDDSLLPKMRSRNRNAVAGRIIVSQPRFNSNLSYDSFSTSETKKKEIE